MDINDALRQIQYLQATKKLTKSETIFLTRIRKELLRGIALNVFDSKKLKELGK